MEASFAQFISVTPAPSAALADLWLLDTREGTLLFYRGIYGPGGEPFIPPIFHQTLTVYSTLTLVGITLLPIAKYGSVGIISIDPQNYIKS